MTRHTAPESPELTRKNSGGSDTSHMQVQLVLGPQADRERAQAAGSGHQACAAWAWEAGQLQVHSRQDSPICRAPGA